RPALGRRGTAHVQAPGLRRDLAAVAGLACQPAPQATAACGSAAELCSTSNSLSTTGDVTVTGTAGLGPGSTGIRLTTSGLVSTVKGSSVGTANVPLVSDSVNFNASGAVAVGAKTATLHPMTNGAAIDLGGAGAAGTLGLTNAELNAITASSINIGDANSGTI